jgi:hypothetical protein
VRLWLCGTELGRTVYPSAGRLRVMCRVARPRLPGPTLVWLRALPRRPFAPHVQSDVVLDVLAPTMRLHHLGIEATSMEMPGFTFLHRYRSGSHFLDITEKR